MHPHKHIKNLVFSFKKYNAIYFRVPKVASTSLLMTFRKFDDVRKVEDYEKYDYKSDFKFAFVRNPFDRLASCFRHVIQKGALKNIQDDSRFYRDMSFKEFVDVISQIKIEDMDIHFRPQHTFIPERPDFLGKFENLNEDFNIVCDKMEIKHDNLIHENKTNKTIYKDYYTDEIIEKVVKLYEKDFELFNYSKTLNL